MVPFCLTLFYQFSKTINTILWLRMARIEMDCNLKTLVQLFQVPFCAGEKIVKYRSWFACDLKI